MSLVYVLFWSVLALVVIYLTGIFVKYWKKKRLLNQIPTPNTNVLFGSLLLVILSDPDTLFRRLREFAKDYYPIFRLSTFYIDIVNILDPNDIELLLSSTKHLSKSRIYDFLKNWLGTGLLTSTGAKWHNRRKILTPAFHFSILQEFVGVFNDETSCLVEQLKSECDNPYFDVVPYVTQFTLKSIGETAMGFSNTDANTLNEYKSNIYKMGHILFKRLSRPYLRAQRIYDLSPLGKEEKKIVNSLHKFSNNIIAEREKQFKEVAYSKKTRLAMLDLLLSTQAAGADIDHEGIREEVDTFMFEGHDTTSMGISFLLLTLANQEEIQNKVLDEILEIVGPTKTPTFTDLQELKFLERCIKESLRLFPAVPFISRYAGETIKTTTGYTIPKGTIVHVHIFDIHRNPRFFPDPLKFDPDRFLPEHCNERHPFAYIPFSAGPRNCIGQRFAILELKAFICGILRSFVLEPVDDLHSVTFRPDLVLRPRDPIKIKIRNRKL